MEFKGTLIPIGGNEDKGKGGEEMYTLDFIQEGILSHVVRESGGTDAKIVVIPTASSIPVEVGENYIEAFNKIGCTDVTVLDIRTRLQAEEGEFVDQVRKADCIMFSGGDQSKISATIAGTSIHEILMDRLKNDPVVIAGTSAGAMAMAHEMVIGGSSSESLVKGAVRMNKGLSLMPGLVIDTHFINRGRFGRLAEAVAAFPNLLGIGLAEDTGLIIKNCDHFKVIGSGMIILFDASNLTHNNFKLLKEGTPMTMANLKVHVLANSDEFQIDQRKLEVLPIDADFI